MATVPLNHFVRASATLGTTYTQVYSTPVDTASIMLLILATNRTSSAQVINVGVSGNGGTNVATRPFYYVVKEFTIPPNDATNIAVGKLTLENYDALFANATNSNSIDMTLSILETLNTQVTI